MKRELTCIVCPNGCDLSAEYTTFQDGHVEVNEVTGNLCPRGKEYVVQELVDPKRTIASSCLVKDGDMPLVSVRVTPAIPKARIHDVMQEIRKICLLAPVSEGQMIIHDVLGLGSDVIATKTVKKK